MVTHSRRRRVDESQERPHSKMTFPVENIVRILATSAGETTTTARSTTTWASELGVRYLRLSTYLVVSYLAYAYTSPIHKARE